MNQKIRKNEWENLDIGVVPAKVTSTPKLVRDMNKGKKKQSKNCNNGLNIPNNIQKMANGSVQNGDRGGDWNLDGYEMD